MFSLSVMTNVEILGREAPSSIDIGKLSPTPAGEWIDEGADLSRMLKARIGNVKNKGDESDEAEERKF